MKYVLIRVEPHFAMINNRRKNLEVAVTVFLRNMQISYKCLLY
jgi:hypothetical protein